MPIKVTKTTPIDVKFNYEGQQATFTADCRRVKTAEIAKFTSSKEDVGLERVTEFVDMVLVGVRGIEIDGDDGTPMDKSEIREFVVNDLQFAKAIQDCYVNEMLGIHEKNSEAPPEASRG